MAGAFRASLNAPDVRRARAVVADARDAGASPGRLYVDVVRPALAALQRGSGGTRARVAAGIGEAILSDLVGRLAPGARAGIGHAAVLSCRAVGIEAVDGSVALDFLEADGWRVERLLADEAEDSISARARSTSMELAVAVTAGPRDALRLAPVCTELRRLPDPPVILLCDFSSRAEHRAAVTALGADAVARDPDELVRYAADRLPEGGSRRWGVRITRSDKALTLVPTGRLDATSAARLAEVAISRLGTFSRLVLDLRDLAEVEPAGLRELSAWADRLPVEGVEVAILDHVAG